MTLDALYERLSELELTHWEFCRQVKNNVVRHPEMGDVFLKEFFRVANPKVELPKEPRKKPDKSSPWYSADKATVMQYYIGSFLRKQKGDKLSVITTGGCKYLFPYVWYLLCLYYGKEVRQDAAGDAGTGGKPERSRLSDFRLREGNLMLECEADPEGRERYRHFLAETDECGSEGYESYGAGELLKEMNAEYRIFYRKAVSGVAEGEKQELDEMFCFELCGMFEYMADRLEQHRAHAEEGGHPVGKLKYEEDPLLYILCLSDIINPLRETGCSEGDLKAVDLEYVAEENRVVIQIDEKFSETEGGKRYVGRLRCAGNKIDIQVDVGTR